MKNTKNFVKKEKKLEERAASDPPDESRPSWDSHTKETKDAVKKVSVDPFDTTLLGHGIPNYVIDPSSLKDKFPPIATQEQLDAVQKLYSQNSSLSSGSVFYEGTGLHEISNADSVWIQTYSGRRFDPTNPNSDAIVIQDIAHALSMQCRFSGHCKKFYSVGQHSVLVSYICNEEDALWGLLHDASEAYLVDVPRPLKKSGKFQAYIDFESKMQTAICKRFGLPCQEPPSVKRADTKLLATEARDLMSPLHPDWKQEVDPLPFKIEAWNQQYAKDMFMKRFFELTGMGPHNYQHYLTYKDRF